MGAARGTVSLVTTLAVSAALAVAAVATVAGAGCPDPGTLVARADGTTELVGGCLDADDLVVPGAPLPEPAPAPGADAVRP